MKMQNHSKKQLLFLLLSFYILQQAHAQPAFNTTRDSIHYFLDSAFSVIKTNALHADRIDWDLNLKEYYKEGLSKTKFRDVFAIFPLVLDQMQDAHSAIWIDSTRYGAKTNFREKRVKNDALASAYSSGKAVLKAERIGDYGYIRIPFINMYEQTVAAKSKKAQELQDLICEIYSTDIKGWIIDLRLNGGGDMYPMIEGIHQFIGNEQVITFVNRNGPPEKISLQHQGLYADITLAAQLPNPCLPDLSSAKVVVLVSQNTASSGELTALTFKGRANTFFIGEKSGGLMTGNTLYQMPFGDNILPMGILISLSTSYEAGRDGKRVDFIYPDLEIQDGDNFDDLSKDLKVIKAIEWMKGRSGR